MNRKNWLRQRGFQLYAPAGGYDPDAIIYWGASEGSLTTARKALDSQFFTDLKAGGHFSRLDCLWMLAHEIETVARRNLIKRSHDLTLGVQPTWVANRGYTGNGTSQYLRTNYIFGTNSVAYSLNSASLGAYVRTNAGGGSMMGVTQTTNLSHILIPTASTAFTCRLNQTATGIMSTFDGAFVGFCAAVRRDAANIYGYKNSTEQTQAQVSVVIPALEAFLLARNSSGTPGLYTSRQCSMAFIGGGMTTAQVEAFRVLVEAYLDAIGAGVV